MFFEIIRKISIVRTKSGDEKKRRSAFSNPQTLKFNLLIINILIFLLTIILDNNENFLKNNIL